MAERLMRLVDIDTHKSIESIERKLKDGEAKLGECVHDKKVVVPDQFPHVQDKMLQTEITENY